MDEAWTGTRQAPQEAAQGSGVRRVGRNSQTKKCLGGRDLVNIHSEDMVRASLYCWKRNKLLSSWARQGHSGPDSHAPGALSEPPSTAVLRQLQPQKSVPLLTCRSLKGATCSFHPAVLVLQPERCTAILIRRPQTVLQTSTVFSLKSSPQLPHPVCAPIQEHQPPSRPDHCPRLLGTEVPPRFIC